MTARLCKSMMFVACFALVASGATAATRSPRPASPGGLTATVGQQQVTPVPCNSVSSCNQVIAQCVAANGTWIEDPDGRSPEGAPGKGVCYLP